MFFTLYCDDRKRSLDPNMKMIEVSYGQMAEKKKVTDSETMPPRKWLTKW